MSAFSGIEGLTGDDVKAIISDNDWNTRATFRAYFRRSLYITTKIGFMWNQSPNLMVAEVFKERSDWIQWVLVDKKRGLLEDPRSIIKSSSSTRPGPYWLALQRPHVDYDFPEEVTRANAFLADHPHLRGVDSRIIIASDAQPRASSFNGSILTEILTNPLLEWLAPELYWPNANRPLYGSMSKETFSLPGRLNPAQPDGFCRAIGIETRAQGGRADGVIIDDLVGEQSVNSPTEIAKRKDFVRGATNLLENGDPQSPQGGFVLLVENRWSLDDVNSMVHDEFNEWAIWRRSIHRCIVHGVGNCGRWRGDETKVCGPSKTPLWLERYPDSDSLARLEIEKGPEMWAAQWLNDPLQASVMSDAKIKPFLLEVAELRDVATGNFVRQHAVVIPPSEGTKAETIAVKALGPHVVSIDVASSEEPGSARTAIEWVAMDRPTRRRFILDCVADRWSPDNAVREAIKLILEVRRIIGVWPTILVEKVAAQVYFATAMLHMAHQEFKVRLPMPKLIPPKRGKGKDNRIQQRFGSVLGQDLVYLRAGLALPRTEVRHFPNGTKDTLDAFVQAEEEFEATFTNASDDEMAERRRHHKLLRIQQGGTTGALLR